MKDDIIGLGLLLVLFIMGALMGPWIGRTIYQVAMVAAGVWE